MLMHALLFLLFIPSPEGMKYFTIKKCMHGVGLKHVKIVELKSSIIGTQMTQIRRMFTDFSASQKSGLLIYQNNLRLKDGQVY
jgi:hypothetical protein